MFRLLHSTIRDMQVQDLSDICKQPSGEVFYNGKPSIWAVSAWQSSGVGVIGILLAAPREVKIYHWLCVAEDATKSSHDHFNHILLRASGFSLTRGFREMQCEVNVISLSLLNDRLQSVNAVWLIRPSLGFL